MQSKKALVWDLLISGVAPWLGYLYLTEHLHWSDYHALLAVTVLPGAAALVGLVRERRLDFIASISLVSILISLGMTALTSSTRLLQLRESYLTCLFGLLFVGSNLIGKPIVLIFARAQVKDPVRLQALEHPRLRGLIVEMTWIWGICLLFEFAVKVWMIFTYSVATVLALGPVVFYTITGLTALWTFWRARRFRRTCGPPARRG